MSDTLDAGRHLLTRASMHTVFSRCGTRLCALLLMAVCRPADAATCDQGEAQCLPGYVWREAFPGDRVCVSGTVRDQAQQDDTQAAARRQSSGELCRAGWVWREAEPDDHVCVTGSTRAQAAADNAAAAARRDPSCSEPTGPNTLDVLTLNFAGTGGGMGPDVAGVPFETRGRRVAAWARRNRVTPDIIAIQEIYGWLYTPPVRSCGRGFAASVGDYDEIDSLLKSLLDLTGVTYRVAYLTGRVASFGISCGIYHAHALLYNPARLVNLTQTATGSVAHDAEAGLYSVPHLRRSLPLCHRGSTLMPLATLIDGPPQTDKCQRPTPSGPADAIFTELGHIAGTHVRFAFAGRPGRFIEVFNLHPTSGVEQVDKQAIQQLMASRLPPPYAGASLLYPPIILGDLNDLDIERDFPSFSTVMNIPGDVGRVGIARDDALPTQLRVRAVRKLMLPDLPSTVSPDKPCRGPMPEQYLVSDHCGLFVRFDVDGADAAALRAVFVDGPVAVSAGAPYRLQAVPSGGGATLNYRWTPGGATTAAIDAQAGPAGSAIDWQVDVTDPAGGTRRSGALTVRVRAAPPAACAAACRSTQTACIADRTHPGWPKPQWCNEQFQECIDRCAP